MNRNLKFLFSAKFILILIVFFLPFLTISCSNGPLVIEVDGIQMVTGDEVRIKQPFSDSDETTKIEAEEYAMLAFLAALAGLTGSLLLRGRGLAANGMIFGLAGGILLFLLKNKFDEKVIEDSRGLVEVRYEFGFWAALALFIAAVLVGLYGLLAESSRPAVQEPAPPDPSGTLPPA